LIPVADQLEIDLGNLRLEAIATPGHAPHHLSFFDRERRKLFPGEAAGVYFPDTGISRPASPPPFDLRRALASLDRLIALQPKELYYSHFGYSSDGLTRLKINREQVISWARTIAERRNEPPEFIADLIIDQDNTRDLIYRFPPARQNTELYFVRNNVRGYLDYFKREGLGILKELGAEN
jgi:glyoxylase-like metal-dependent hydrolase (beta-lactamase superfamily II)